MTTPFLHLILNPKRGPISSTPQLLLVLTGQQQFSIPVGRHASNPDHPVREWLAEQELLMEQAAAAVGIFSMRDAKLVKKKKKKKKKSSLKRHSI